MSIVKGPVTHKRTLARRPIPLSRVLPRHANPTGAALQTGLPVMLVLLRRDSEEANGADGRPLKSAPNSAEREAMLRISLEQMFWQGLISRAVVGFAWSVWEQLAWEIPGLPVPDLYVGPDASLLYLWDRNEHQLGLEFSPGEPGSFYYANRDTGALWEASYLADGPLSAEVKGKLALFVAQF